MTTYEWDIEETDEYGDIVDHHHFDKLKDIPDIDGDLVLVKSIWRGDTLAARFWAYVENGILPEYFEDSRGWKYHKVPQKFRKEYEKHLKN